MTPKHRKLFGNMEQVLDQASSIVLADSDSPQAAQRRMFANFCRTLDGRSIARQVNAETEHKVAALAPRVRQTLERLLVGDSEKQVARQLGLSQNTIHVYVKSIYRAFNVSSRGELMTHFVSDKWLTSPELTGDDRQGLPDQIVR